MNAHSRAPQSMTPASAQRGRGSFCLRAVGVSALLLGAVWALQGQPLNFGKVKDFIVPDYFDPPRENQLRSRLSGTDAQPLAGGLFLIKGIKLESYRLDGLCEFRITAPECTYDNTRRAAYSTSTVHLESGDGQLVVDGRGFHWQQSNAIVTISNDQRTVISPLTNRGTNLHR